MKKRKQVWQPKGHPKVWQFMQFARSLNLRPRQTRMTRNIEQPYQRLIVDCPALQAHALSNKNYKRIPWLLGRAEMSFAIMTQSWIIVAPRHNAER